MRKFLGISTISLLLAAPAQAAAPDRCADAICAGDGPALPASRTAPEQITVLGTGGWQLVADAGQSISVLGAGELDALQTPDLTAALTRLPGVTFSRNGGLGAFTGVRVRGASSEQVLVLVDGIRVGDVAAPGGGTDFGTLAASGFGKVELLRGSNSVVWGSEAIGGVIALTSRRIEGLEASAEYGARDTANGQLGAGIVTGAAELTVNGGYTRTDGFSTAAAGTEADGFRQWRVNGTGLLRLAEGLSAVFAGRYADSRLEFDGASYDPPYGLVDTPEYSDITDWSGRAGFEYSAHNLHLDGGLAIHRLDRTNYNPDLGGDPTFAARGRQERAELKGRIGARDGLRVDFGAEYEWQRFSTTYDAGRKARTASGHALLGWSGRRVNLAAGARLDDHSGFGRVWTFGANGAVEFARDWRLRASWGEGFKVPTLYQLYSDFGDPGLRPERSISYDLGIERGTRAQGLHMAVTLFRRDSRNLIDFAACTGAQCASRPFGLYQNVGKARAQGFEIELGAALGERLRVQAAYSHIDTRDRTPGGFNRGNDLARRPRHAVTVSADWTTPLAGLAVGGDVRMVSDSYDDAGNFTRLDGHALASLRASLPLGEHIEVYGRIENLAGAQYQTAAGYGTPGRSAFVGARARF